MKGCWCSNGISLIGSCLHCPILALGKISSNSENLQSVIEIYENLFYLLDRNLDRFLSFKKEAENEKKKYGEMQKDYWANKPNPTGSLTLEDFAKQFAVAYNQ